MKNEKNELLDLFTNIELNSEFPLRNLITRAEQKPYRVVRHITDPDYMVFPEIRESAIIKFNKYGLNYKQIIQEKWNIRKEKIELKKLLNSDKKEKRSRL